MELDNIRRDYSQGGLRRKDLQENPVNQFTLWLQQAIDSGLKDPTAMTVATVSPEGMPSQRIVLLKHVDEQGFVFYTNLESRKAQDLAHNQNISLHFPWHGLERQVKIQGVAERVSAAESLKYFLSRPKDSQLAAWASAQSRPVSSRQLLMQQFARMKEKFSEGDIPLPSFWGGYRVRPSQIEFWQGGDNRLHDRFVYRSLEDQTWSVDRLAP
jgi:pyridoxamine 5'-phosphate oxidase